MRDRMNETRIYLAYHAQVAVKALVWQGGLRSVGPGRSRYDAAVWEYDYYDV